MSALDNDADREQERDYSVTALDRAFSLLDAVAAAPGSSLSDLARQAGFTRSLAFRLAHTLEKNGYLSRGADGRSFYLGYRPLQLAASAQDHIPMLQAARPFISGLAKTTGQNVNLVVRDGIYHLTILAHHPADPDQLFARTGRRGPLHVGGAPKILLAFAPPDIRETVLRSDLRRYTETTVADPDALIEILAEIRRTGTNETRGDLDQDGFSFAAAIFNAEGQVVAAVSLAGRLHQLSPEDGRNYRYAVRSTAQRISETIGWRPWVTAY